MDEALLKSLPVVGIGAGGHAAVLLEILLGDPRCRVVGLLDPVGVGRTVCGVPVLGPDILLPELARDGRIEGFFVGLGGVRELRPRQRLFESAMTLGLKPVTIVHATAVVSPSAVLGLGTAVLAQACIGAGATVGDNAIVNTGAVVEHDCRVGPHVHVATGALLAGGVTVGPCALVGVGAVIRQGVRIGSRTLVGAGAVVVADVPDETVVVGNPARPLQTPA